MNTPADGHHSAMIVGEFAHVMAEIASVVYAPGSEQDSAGDRLTFNEFLNSESCPVMQFLGRRMGCSVTRWFFYDREHDDLQPFHERVSGGIDPLWMDVRSYDQSTARFDFDILSPAEKARLDQEQSQAGVRKSVDIFYRWFLTGNWLRTESERRSGWVFVPTPELGIGCFEWLLLRRLWEAVQDRFLSRGVNSQSDQEHSQDIINAEALVSHPDFARVVGSVVEELMQTVCHGQTWEDCLANVREWVGRVLRSDPSAPNPDPEYAAWFEDSRPCREWFVNLGWANRDFAEGCKTWEELAALVLKHSTHRLHAEAAEKIEEVLRFSPQMEMILRSRSVVFFPLWLGRDHQGSVVTAPYTAFVIANFFDDRIITDRVGSLIRALFTFMALPDIIEFGIDSYEQAQVAETEKESAEFFASCLGHDMKNKLVGVSGALRMLLEQLAAGADVPSVAQRRMEEILRLASRAAEDARRRADTMLDAIRIKKPAIVRTDLDRLTEDTVGLVGMAAVCQDRDVRIELQKSPLGFGHLDQDMVSRAMENLLLNAAKASREGGTVLLKVQRNSDSLVIAVEDEGPGIPDNIARLAMAQQPPALSGRPALGVGLRSVRNAVIECHRGTLRFQRREPRGTIATIVIPLVARENAQ